METREDARAPERRAVFGQSDLRAIRRADGEEGLPRIVFHAVVYDQWTTLYEDDDYLLREIVRPGACRNALAAGEDVRALLNHDANYIFARSTVTAGPGALRLSEDSVGLLCEAEPLDTQVVRDQVVAPISARLITGSSFAFTVWGSGRTTTTESGGSTVIDTGGDRTTYRRDGNRFVQDRELTNLHLFDASPVTYPAYEQTDVALRSLAGLRELRAIQEKRARLVRLGLAEKRLRLFDAAVPNAKG